MARRGATLPSVTSQIPQDLRNFIERLREVVDGTLVTRDEAVTRDDVDARVSQIVRQTELTNAREQDQQETAEQITEHVAERVGMRIDQMVSRSRLYRELGERVEVGGRTVLEVAGEVTDLGGQYTVKIDSNGYVSGFGLASVPVDGANVSEFYIRADRFAIGAPGASQVIPFKVLTTAQELADYGVAQPGVYMDAAYITRLTANFSELGISAQDIIDHAGLGSLATAEDVPVTKVTGLGGLATSDTVNYLTQLSNKPVLGPLASKSSVDAGTEVTGLGSLATRDTARLGNEVTLSNGTTLYESQLIGTLAQLGSITSGNIANVMGTSAITNAYIGYAAVSTLKIAGNAVTVGQGYINNTAYSGAGVGSWVVLSYQSLSNTSNDSAVRVLLQFTARVGYYAGAASVRFQITHFPSYSVIADSGQTEGYADYVALSGAVDMAAYGTGTFVVRFYATNSSTKVVTSCFLLSGLKR